MIKREVKSPLFFNLNRLQYQTSLFRDFTSIFMKEEKDKNNKKDWRKGHIQDKKQKNKKNNLGGSYKFKIAKKYSKPKTRGDKIKNRKRK